MHIIDHLGLGGAQSVVRGISDHRTKGGIIIDVFSLRQSNYERDIDRQNMQIYPSTRKYSFKPLLVIRKLIMEGEVDILHCHLFRSQVFGWILKSVFFPEIGLIYHEHGTILRKNIVTDLFFRLSKNAVDLFIAVSEVTKEKLVTESYVSESKIKTLHNYVDIKKFNEKKINWDVDEEKVKLGFGEDDFVVGFAGRIIEMKGWRVFLSAAELLKEREEIKFLIAGEGSEREALKGSIEERKLENNVIYLGHVEDMAWFYSLLDCFVMPSWWEAMGVSILESLAMNVPVIVSDVAALNELVSNEENGLLFTPQDPKDLANKIVTLVKTPDLFSRIVEQGLKTAHSHRFSNYREKLSHMYRKI